VTSSNCATKELISWSLFTWVICLGALITNWKSAGIASVHPFRTEAPGMRLNELLTSTEALHSRQHPLDETTAFVTAAPLRTLPPQDAPTQHALGVVVGRFDPFDAGKGPQRRSQRQQIGAETLQLAQPAALSHSQRLFQALTHGSQFCLQFWSVPRPVPEAMPAGDQFAHDFQAGLAEALCGPRTLCPFLEVSLQVSPTDLPTPRLQRVVGLLDRRRRRPSLRQTCRRRGSREL
jgi:hypothetical protein